MRRAILKKAGVALLAISAKEDIGRAKFVEADKYQAEYAAIAQAMESEIAAIAEKGGEDE